MLLGTRRYIAGLDRLEALTAFVEACAVSAGLVDPVRSRLLLAAEESFVNICNHAYPETAGEAEISCVREGDCFVLTIADTGIPFDMLSLPPPDTSVGVMERAVGGLGIHFIRTLSDGVSYRREQDRNVLRVTFRITGQ